MKKLVLILVALFICTPMSAVHAADPIVHITSKAHQTFSGEFRNDELAQELLPTGSLGKLVFTPTVKNKVWVIDPALIDEVIAMTADYKLASDGEPVGTEAAIAWINQLKQITNGQEVIALAYGNPDVSLAKRLAPSELRKYYAFGKSQLETALDRTVRSEPSGGWSKGKSSLNNQMRKQYSDNRKALTKLSRVVTDPQLIKLRAQLAKLLSPSLDKEAREFFSNNANTAVAATVNKLRINGGKYQITTSNVKLPVTVINEFDTDVIIDVAMVPINSRVIVDSFVGVTIPANSKRQLEMKVEVIAPGQTVVTAQITDDKGYPVVPEALLSFNSTVIDARVTWFTTGAAILLLLAAAAQSVRRVRRRVK